MSLNCKKYPANIHLDEDVLKTPWGRLSSSSSESVLKTSSTRLDQDEYIRPSHLSSEVFFKTSSRRLDQDQYIRLDHTSSIRLQDVLKASSRRLARTSSRPLQDIFNTSCQDVFKTSSRCLQKCLQFSRKKVFAVAKISTSVRKIIPEFIYAFFSVLSFLNFAMKKWFCCVKCFVKIFGK